MSHEFHDLAGYEPLPDGSRSENPRTKELLSEIGANRDCELIAVFKGTGDAAGYDALTLTLDTHEVPGRNPVGIQFRERLALIVPAAARKLIEVVPLRKDFPITLHQNVRGSVPLRTLCLDIAPPDVIAATWTAKSWIKRISWWMEIAAKGELHAPERPPEQLFYSPKGQVVLPPEYKHVDGGAESYLVFSTGVRPDGGLTLHLLNKGSEKRETTTMFLELSAPPLVHQAPRLPPKTLGELVDVLGSNGKDFVGKLSTLIQGSIPSAGMVIGKSHPSVLLLVSIPLKRAESADVERVDVAAYFVATDTISLGAKLGALIKMPGNSTTYFSAAGMLEPQETHDWRAVEIDAFEVLRRPTDELRRLYSAISENGPEGTLVGTGALGSALMQFWGRGGWGRWTVIDNDFVRPHNPIRHASMDNQIGMSKVHAIAQLHAALGAESEVKMIWGDASVLDNEIISEAVTNTEFVVDASTTVIYPRSVSLKPHAARHASVFLTPNGLSSVMMIENVERSIRLHTLEAQYFRAVLESEWGSSHLAGNISHFWSGAGCRDLSSAMSWSSISLHAANLADQIRVARLSPSAGIRIWTRDEATGAIVANIVTPEAELRWELGDLVGYADAGLERKLRAMRDAALPNETGGILLGYFDFNINVVMIVDALSPPQDSKATPTSFVRGTHRLKQAVEEAARRTGRMVRYIGEWHSHPKNMSAAMSRDDLVQLGQLAIEMAEEGLPVLQLRVGEHDIQVNAAKLVLDTP